MAPGLLPGRADTQSGLLSWVVATRHLPALEATGALVEHVLALPEAGDAWVLPGLQSASQAGALAGGGWTRLATAVAAVPLGAGPGRGCGCGPVG